MTDWQVSNNPACNPIRPWIHDPDTEIEAYFLVRRLDPIARKLLHVLAGHPDQAVTTRHLQNIDQAFDDATVSGKVARIEQLSEALGFVPLVRLTSNGYTVTAAAASVTLAALSRSPA